MCKTNGCDKPVMARGMCGACYQRLVKLMGGRATFVAPSNLCAFGDCSEPAKVANIYCRKHRRQMRETGRMWSLLVEKPKDECAYELCNRVAQSKGLCNAHRAQQLRGKELSPLRTYWDGKTCQWGGCPDQIVAKGLCLRHYRRQRDGLPMDRPAEISCRHCGRPVQVKHLGVLPEACPDCRRIHNRASAYGLTYESYTMLLNSQGGACAICGELPDNKRTRDQLHVDHDHSNGAVRGLLCGNCNIGLGNFQDDPKRLIVAAHYVTASGDHLDPARLRMETATATERKNHV